MRIKEQRLYFIKSYVVLSIISIVVQYLFCLIILYVVFCITELIRYLTTDYLVHFMLCLWAFY